MVAFQALARRTRRTAVVLGVLAVLALAAAALWPRAGPAEANPLGGMTAVAAGAAHTCAVSAAGGVVCWGYNVNGQLGDGTSDSDPHPIPTDAVGLGSGTATVSGGQLHTCAVTTTGGVKCWGLNLRGQLGDGTTADRATAVDVVGLVSGVAAVSAGGLHTCALTTAGGVKCWGYNAYGQLGGGSTESCFGVSCSTTPVDVVGLSSGVAAVAAGGNYTCALTTAGGVTCWGDDIWGQLGDGSLTSGVAAVSTGGAHTCALTTAGGLKCWGRNNQAQLGDGTNIDQDIPVDVSGLTSGVAAVSAGAYHTCALTTAGGVKCWGAGFSSTPAGVPGLDSGVAAVAAGGDHTCALTTAAGVKCWGSNGNGQLGNGTTTSSDTPVDAVELVAKPTPTPTPCPGGICPTLTATSTPAPCPVEACMSLLVKDGAVSCTAGTPLEQVCVPLGGGFTLAVNVVKAPEQGYIAVQTYIDYGAELTYKPTGAAADEFVWPDAVLAFRHQRAPGLVNHAGITAPLPPLPVSTFEGNIVELAFDCSAELSETTIRLLPLGDPVADTDGAGFLVNFATPVAVPPDSLTLNCVQPPTPTATPTTTPTATPTATPTSLPLGGSGVFPDLAEGGGSSGPGLGAMIAAVAAAVSALGGLAGAAWYARRAGR